VNGYGQFPTRSILDNAAQGFCDRRDGSRSVHTIGRRSKALQGVHFRATVLLPVQSFVIGLLRMPGFVSTVSSFLGFFLAVSQVRSGFLGPIGADMASRGEWRDGYDGAYTRRHTHAHAHMHNAERQDP